MNGRGFRAPNPVEKKQRKFFVLQGLSKVHGNSTLFELANRHSGYSSDDESDEEKSDDDHQAQAVEKELSAEERAYEQVGSF